jgi:spore maturation protein CgeB
MKVVIFGLSVTSSLANGHAATYRTLMTELARRGHEVLFLERNLPWYAERRDIPRSRFGRVEIYETLEELHHQHLEEVRTADCVIVGSSIPEASGVADWVASESSGVTGFYDVETSLLRFAGVEDAVTLYYGVDALLYFPKT